MKISDLKKHINAIELNKPTHAVDDLFVYGATADDRQVRGGYVFCALESKVRKFNPNTGALEPQADKRPHHIRRAVAAGAQVIVVGDRLSIEDLNMDAFQLSKIVVLKTQNPEAAFAQLASWFTPARPQNIVAVTGTNGKSSTVSIVRDIWRSFGFEGYSLGTLGLVGEYPCNQLIKNLTTPEADSFCTFLGEIATRHGATHLALEASSQGLGDEERQAGVSFMAAGFTNFTQDHLDYHGFDYKTHRVFDHDSAMERYFGAKLRLFTERLADGGTAVVNIDDAKGREIVRHLEEHRSSVKIITYSRQDSGADIFSIDDDTLKHQQKISLAYNGETLSVDFPLVGEFQRENALCAIGLAIATKVPFGAAVGALSSVSQIIGRMELVQVANNPRRVFVDYAHTDGALKSVLESMGAAFPDASLSVLFGCAGDRDVAKRRDMAAWAMRLADKVYVSDDNPRSEDPLAIRKQVMVGCAAIIDPRGQAINAGPREAAIRLAVSELSPDGVLIIAGKGHEDYQEIDGKGTKEPFSDQAVARAALSS